MRTILIGVLALAIGCGGDKKEEAKPAGAEKATADQCKAAYTHLADLAAKKNGGTTDDWLKTQQGNIESCPKMITTKGVDCMNAMTAWDMMKWKDCVELK
jgi:hypothetical protein